MARVSTGPNQISGFAREAVENQSDMIIVYGGDGTLIEVINGVVGSAIPILVLRGGTGNVIASELGLPETVEESLQIIKQPSVQTMAMDLGLINREKYFILRCGCGLEVQALQETNEQAKAQWGIAAYVQGLFSAATSAPELVFRIQVDDAPEIIEVSGVLLTVANAGEIGVGDLKINPGTRIDDGLLDICLVKTTGILSIMELLKMTTASDKGLEMGDLSSTKPVLYQQARKISISTDRPIPFQADGDIIGETPLMIEVVPKAGIFVCKE